MTAREAWEACAKRDREAVYFHLSRCCEEIENEGGEAKPRGLLEHEADRWATARAFYRADRLLLWQDCSALNIDPEHAQAVIFALIRWRQQLTEDRYFAGRHGLYDLASRSDALVDAIDAAIDLLKA